MTVQRDLFSALSIDYFSIFIYFQNYRVRYLIYSANTSLNTEHITIYFCEQTLSGHCLTITDHIKPKILCLSLNATSAEAKFELGAEQCI